MIRLGCNRRILCNTLFSPLARPLLARFSEYSKGVCRVTIRFVGKFGPNTQNIVDNYYDVPLENCRTFSIIAHIDHGKSTLADAIMKQAGNIPKDAQAQFLDNLEVERERGITVKAQTASMLVRSKQDNENYLLNLIDTPGHVDFSVEVERCLRVLDGGIAVLDGVAGVEAQSERCDPFFPIAETVWEQANRYKLPRLLYVNKLDRVGADFEHSVSSLHERKP